MTNTFKTAAAVAARLTLAAIMSTLMLGSAVVPVKAAPATSVTVDGGNPTDPLGIHRGVDLMQRRLVVAHLACRNLSGVNTGAAPAPHSCEGADWSSHAQRSRIAAGTITAGSGS